MHPDIDECAEGDSGCSQICVNTPGSYYCTCELGFAPNGPQCEGTVIQNLSMINPFHTLDIDECEVISLCDHQCVNTEGSFYCTCRDGYQLFRSSFCIGILYHKTVY